MGQSEVGQQAVDPAAAVATALQAFQDGLFLVVVDGIDYTGLDQLIPLRDDSRITFIRLTPWPADKPARARASDAHGSTSLHDVSSECGNSRTDWLLISSRFSSPFDIGVRRAEGEVARERLKEFEVPRGNRTAT